MRASILLFISLTFIPVLSRAQEHTKSATPDSSISNLPTDQEVPGEIANRNEQVSDTSIVAEMRIVKPESDAKILIYQPPDSMFFDMPTIRIQDSTKIKY